MTPSSLRRCKHHCKARQFGRIVSSRKLGDLILLKNLSSALDHVLNELILLSPTIFGAFCVELDPIVDL